MTVVVFVESKRWARRLRVQGDVPGVASLEAVHVTSSAPRDASAARREPVRTRPRRSSYVAASAVSSVKPASDRSSPSVRDVAGGGGLDGAWIAWSATRMFDRLRSLLVRKRAIDRSPSPTERAETSGDSWYEAEQSGVRYRVCREGQRLGLAVAERWSADVSPSVRDVAGGGAFTSAAVLALKAKQVDDGLYAAVDLAAQRGAGVFCGRRAVLRTLLERVSADGDAHAVIEAAASLGENAPCKSPAVEALRAAFLADPSRSKPLGFYTWSEDLGRVFRQDRLLQSDVSRSRDLRAVTEAIRADPALRASYEACLRLPERLTNPLACADLRGLMGALDDGRSFETTRPLALFPASRAHETELVNRMYPGNRLIPDDFDLMRELIRAVRSNELDLTPSDASGWYDVQTWALETLVAPERAEEARSVELAPSYVEHLEELFRGILTATRETHIKQLDVPPFGSAAPRVTKLQVAPQLTVEPLVTYYKRRADAYRFVRAALAEAFGEEALGTLHGLRSTGRVTEPLGVELTSMIRLFDGAAATAMHELGIPTTGDRAAFATWRGGEGDPDVNADLRAMVPVFFDVDRCKTKVWMIVGWERRSLFASFARPPRVELLGNANVEIEPSSSFHPVATPVMAEAYVSRLLDRDEFRAHCDRHRTNEAIVAALA